jgi:hypothetical protein
MPAFTDQGREAREATEAEKAQRERVLASDEETRGMAAAFAALVPLGRNARKRALRWLADALEDIEVPF